MKNAKKGFTLVEMLIVVAIIAILVAIAIPVLNGQLENAREAADAANLRAAYAEAAIDALSTGTSGSAKSPVIITQKTPGWTSTVTKIGNVDIKSGDMNTVKDGDSVAVSVDATGTAIFTVTKASK